VQEANANGLLASMTGTAAPKRYVAIENFVINNQTTREDVDELIALIKRLF